MQTTTKPEFVYKKVDIETPLLEFLKSEGFKGKIFDPMEYMDQVVRYDRVVRIKDFEREHSVHRFFNHYRVIIMTLGIFCVTSVIFFGNPKATLPHLIVLPVIIAIFLMEIFGVKLPEQVLWTKILLKNHPSPHPMKILTINLNNPGYFEIEVYSHPGSRLHFYQISDSTKSDKIERYYFAYIERPDRLSEVGIPLSAA